jgi:hypothetical protein
MRVKSFLIDFGATFAVALVVSVLVTLLWNLSTQGQAIIDWETSLRLAVIFGMLLPLRRVWERKLREA